VKLGAGVVIFPEAADSNPNWTAVLACHMSKNGKYVSIFSLCC
jgi:hypothetical protein